MLTEWLKVKISVGAGTRFGWFETAGPDFRNWTSDSIFQTGTGACFSEPILEPKPECKLELGSQFHLCSGPESNKFRIEGITGGGKPTNSQLVNRQFQSTVNRRTGLDFQNQHWNQILIAGDDGDLEPDFRIHVGVEP